MKNKKLLQYIAIIGKIQSDIKSFMSETGQSFFSLVGT